MTFHSNGFYVTTPIYYVNDVPHIGHAYTTIAADVLARFYRLKKKPVFFLTGTDEHGQKVEKAAAQRGKTPKDHADEMVDNFKTLWAKLSISNDAFIRTTDEGHKKTVKEILQALWDKGKIEKRSYEGMYCTPCERFWTEKDLVKGNCPDCGRHVESIEEENYFFLMSRYKEKLIRYIEENPYYILPETRKNEVLGFLRNKPLGDLCISRPRQRLSWGIPLPFDPHYTTYVWFDALLNYYSATLYLAPDTTFNQTRSGNWWPANHHLIGKDILTTHAVYWSTMLMALDMPLPKNIFAHGWWTVDGQKMSKSVGNVVDPYEVAATFGADAFRFFLFREVPFGLDGDFSREAVINRINNDLANDFGNLASRTFAMIDKYCHGLVPEPGAVEVEMKELAESIKPEVEESLLLLDFHKALDQIWRLVSHANRYIDAAAPWVLARDPSKKTQLESVLYSCVEALRFLCLYLFPFMPNTTRQLWEQLGIASTLEDESLDRAAVWGLLQPGTKIKKRDSLFPRIEKTAQKSRENANKEEGYEMSETGNGLINIDNFAKVELKVGIVVSAEKVEKSNKLIKLQVDTGEMRQVVAGIGKAYRPEELIGKRIIVLTNLQPARLMGVESQGMLLAASESDSFISVLTLDREIKPGTRIR